MTHTILSYGQIISILKNVGIEISKADLDRLLNDTQSNSQSPFGNKEPSTDSLVTPQCSKPCQNCCNENKTQVLRNHLDRLTSEAQQAVQHLKQTDKNYRHLHRDNLRSAALRVSYHSGILLSVLEKILPRLLKAYEAQL